MTDKTDHQRGCAGRDYTCTCGYDDARDNRFKAFKQEVSDVVEEYKADQPYVWKQSASDYFCRFIIPKPKPDPLVEVCKGIGFGHTDIGDMAENLSIALDTLGFEIREKGQRWTI